MLLFTERVEELVDLYGFCFLDETEVRKFIEGLNRIGDEKRNALRILNQTQRLIYLADNADKLKRGRDALKLLFLIICAEAVAKLYEDYDGEYQSKEHVELFFLQLCESQDLKGLDGAIIKSDKLPTTVLSSTEVVRFLYKIRCAVVHEGTYWEFQFRDSSKLGIPLSHLKKTETTVATIITYKGLRDIIIRGALRAIKLYLKK